MFLESGFSTYSNHSAEPFDHADSWLWNYSKNGRYSVRSGYNLALSGDSDMPSSSSDALSAWWKEYWATKILRKILTFGWRDSLSLVQALTKDNEYQNEMGILISDIKMLLEDFSGATISHVANVKHSAPQKLELYFTGATNILYTFGGHAVTV
ncbi:hypothetical protein AgCh_007798 [Apium graveolens]